MNKQTRAALSAILAAALYAVNVPLSKLLLAHVGPAMMAALLYLGAGLGLLAYALLSAAAGKNVVREPLTRRELPYVAAMVALDVAAPILLMLGIARTASANVSLLNNFEIVATSLVALVFFGEVVSKRLWAAIALVTAASILLSYEGAGSLRFGAGSLFVLAACACWGVENNCTKRLSVKSPVQIVTIKGCFSGLGSLLVALLCGESLPAFRWVCAVLLLGFVSYGLSIDFYIRAQKDLGAAKTSAFYAVAPFLGAAFSMLLLGERPGPRFYAALLVMAAGTALVLRDTAAQPAQTNARDAAGR
ncbi:MAG: DMT family transporter [Oscillospiraceae bacterium]|nr:DMT family transporter [Oscillospiraceae bacterium]